MNHLKIVTSNTDERAVSINQACELLAGCSRPHIYKLAKQGAFGIVKVGHKSAILRSELNAYLTGLSHSNNREAM